MRPADHPGEPRERGRVLISAYRREEVAEACVPFTRADAGVRIPTRLR